METGDCQKVRQAGITQGDLILHAHIAAVARNERSREATRPITRGNVHMRRQLPAEGCDLHPDIGQYSIRRAKRATPAAALHIADASKLFEPCLPPEIIFPLHARGGRRPQHTPASYKASGGNLQPGAMRQAHGLGCRFRRQPCDGVHIDAQTGSLGASLDFRQPALDHDRPGLCNDHGRCDQPRPQCCRTHPKRRAEGKPHAKLKQGWQQESSPQRDQDRHGKRRQQYRFKVWFSGS